MLQERFCGEVWQLLVACLLMTRVSSADTKDRALAGFFHAYPTPSAFQVLSLSRLPPTALPPPPALLPPLSAETLDPQLPGASSCIPASSLARLVMSFAACKLAATPANTRRARDGGGCVWLRVAVRGCA